MINIRLPKLQLNHDNKLFWSLFSPVFGISIITCAFLILSRFNDLDDTLYQRTQHITEQVATTSEYAIVFSDQNMMYRILQNALSNQYISSVQLFNSEQKIIAELGTEFVVTTTGFPTTNEIQKLPDHLVSISAVHYNNNALDGAFNPQADLFGPIRQQNLIGWVKIQADTAIVQIQKYQYASLVLLVFFAFNLGSGLIFLRITKQLMLPVKNVENTLNKLAKEQFSAAKLLRLPVEYQSLQKDLLFLTERLEHNRHEMTAGIEQATEDLRRSMDSMEEKSAQLHIANREAMESNRLKSQFLANISHEVRTPLNAILGYTKTLQKGIKDPQHKLYIDTIEQSTNSLLAIIGDILDFSKIEAGKLSLESNHFNLRALIDDVYQTLSINLLTKEKQIDLVTEYDVQLPEWIIGDSTRIRQILTNLIGNAIKFTHQGSVKTKVSCQAQSDNKLTLLFQIVDTGIGIPEHKIDRLFKPFSQVDTSTTRQFGGTGLGLVISKKLVEQMQGKIEVSSDPSIGSTFRFSLCLQASGNPMNQKDSLDRHIILLEPSSTYRAHLTSYLHSIGVKTTRCSDIEQLVSALQEKADTIDGIVLSLGPDESSVEETKELISYANQHFSIPCIVMIQPPRSLTQNPELKALASEILLKPVSHDRLYKALQQINHREIQVDEISPPVESNQTRKGLKILAVDDAPINLQLLSHWLQPHGINVTLAYSGQQALSLASEQTFDLIFMDIQMPEMDGMETTQQLRQLKSYQNTPIIALTAHALGSEQQQILASGMNAYLTKPIDEEVLFRTIDEWCSNTKTFQQQVDATLVNIFDMQKALDIVNGKADIAQEMFTMLADSLDNEKKLIQHHLEHQDTEKLIEVVHRIHGASKYTGTFNVARHAGFLETHLKELGMEDVEGVAEDFIHAIDDLLNHRDLITWPQE
ncbi:response regulator [Marinomonas sp. TW1]|uniref:response regulator n=1 Tax=Marinomonas sp. TW1 TaxID=1561203 RepID=UPI0007AF623B|nr:response regulator [Marinomonas sp. TW1]KZN12781.1 histidine kinase [Marinomonas sp. TW1]